MQSIFRLPWCSDQLGVKMAEKPCNAMRTFPPNQTVPANALKRKSLESQDPGNAPAPLSIKKARIDSAHSLPSMPAKTEDVTAVLSESPCRPVSSKVSRASLEQAIENTFNMSILAKHNELRLIEQELAKCQIALEQLRRCELQPFPGATQLSMAVTDGVGPAVVPPEGFSQPPHPAPYGVIDGPYSRHYRQWLLQDANFDPLSSQALAAQAENASAAGRSTRNSGSARKSVPKAVGCSTRSESLQSIPNYPSAPPKDKSAPLVLRRSTDGLMVKLICNNCHRGNFSSIQGFLNHCRIAHKVDYKSHDMAAIDCGRPLDESELASLSSEAQPAAGPITPISAAPKPAPSRTASIAMPAHVNYPGHARNLVHPLNTPHANNLSTASTSVKASRAPVPSIPLPAPRAVSQVPFKASAQTPHLSSYFAKHQLGGDLAQAIAHAKQHIDLDLDDEESMSPDALEGMSLPVTPYAGARTVAAAGVRPNADEPPTSTSAVVSNTPPQQRPASRKANSVSVSMAPCAEPGSAQSRPRPAPVVVEPASRRSHIPLDPRASFTTSSDTELATPTELNHQPPSLSHSPSSSSSILSPHTLAADSNPGLVSDHEDDDLRDGYGSVSDEDAPMHNHASPRTRLSRGHGPVLHRSHHQHHSIPMVDMVGSAPAGVRPCGGTENDANREHHHGVRVHPDEGVHLDVDVDMVDPTHVAVHDDKHDLVRQRFIIRRSSLVNRNAANPPSTNPAWRSKAAQK